ncbi:MAG TPA: tetratricopeptide repeat protein [Terriglobia bacterium]|jgi:tetratricopeptide (TPR) repeat protein
MPARASSPKAESKPKRSAPVRPGFDSAIPHLLVLVAITVIAYANGMNGKFVFDDQQIVMQPNLMNVHKLADAFAIGTGWRQLLFFTYGLNYYFSGVETFSYHLVNLVLHVINVVLVYWIILAALRGELRARFAAFAGAAVFAVHPLFSAAVTYIAGRSSELCGTFYFASILLFFKALDSARRDLRVLCFALAGVSGLLAWQAKQEAITLPLFLAAVVFLRTEKKDWRWIAALGAIPFVTVIVVRDQIRAIYATVGGNQILVNAGFDKVLPAGTYFRTYATAVVSYFFPRFVAPVALSADPKIPAVDHWYSPEFLFSVAIFGVLAWMALRFYRSAPLLSLGLTALLVSPIAAYAVIPLADVVLEHRAYIPGLGVAFLFAWAFQWLASNYKNLGWPAMIAILVTFTVMTNSRNNVYANNIALWEDAVAKAPDKARPHFNLGQAYQDSQHLPEAVREYQAALAIKPDIQAAYSNIAAIYLDHGELDKAEEVLRKVTTLAPDFTEGFINLAVLYIRKREPDKAIASVNRALEINPDSFAAHYNKGEALSQKGDFKAALESYKRAVYLRPDMTSFKLTLGAAYDRAGERGSAQKVFEELTSTPLAPDAYRSLGTLYNEEGQFDEAVLSLERAVQLRPSFPDAYHELGVTYLRKQMLDAAIREFRTTLEQQPDHIAATLNLAMVEQMKGDIPAARQPLQEYLRRYGATNSPYVAQVRKRLALLH